MVPLFASANAGVEILPVLLEGHRFRIAGLQARPFLMIFGRAAEVERTSSATPPTPWLKGKVGRHGSVRYCLTINK
jgi:hypothetical protein